MSYLTDANVLVNSLPMQRSLSIEQAWRTIYGNVFVGRPRMRVGAKAEAEFAQIQCAQYYLIPFNFDLPGTPIRARKHNQCGIECQGKLVSLASFHTLEFFVCSPELVWTMVYTHEDYAYGGPYFMRRQWIP